MKKLLVACALCLAFAASFAFAGPGEDLYNTKCAKCHGKDGAHATGGVTLKGQSVEDIEAKLTGYKDGSYGGERKKTMVRMVDKLTAMEIRELSRHIGSL